MLIPKHSETSCASEHQEWVRCYLGGEGHSLAVMTSGPRAVGKPDLILLTLWL